MLDKIWLFLESFIEKAINLVEWLFLSVINGIADLFYFIIDITLTVLTTLVEAVDFSQVSVLQAFNDWNLLPAQVIWILDYMNFAQCLTLLAGAYGIRLLLNLIPAAVTRV